MNGGSTQVMGHSKVEVATTKVSGSSGFRRLRVKEQGTWEIVREYNRTAVSNHNQFYVPCDEFPGYLKSEYCFSGFPKKHGQYLP